MEVGKICSFHVEEKLRFYCIDCRENICSTCIDNIHSNHSFCTIQKAMETKRNNLIKNVDLWKERQLKQLHDMSDKIQTLKQICANKTEELTRVINDRVAELVDLLQKIGQELVHQLLDHQEDGEKPLTAAQIKIDQCISNVMSYCVPLEEVDQMDDNELSKFETLQEEMESEVKDIIDQDSLNITNTLVFEAPKELEIENIFGKLVQVTNDVKFDEKFGDQHKQCLFGENDSMSPSDETDSVVQVNEEECCSVCEEDDNGETESEQKETAKYEMAESDRQQPLAECTFPSVFTIEGKSSVHKIMPFGQTSIFTLLNCNVKFINLKHVKTSQDIVDGETVLQNVVDATLMPAGHLLFIERNDVNVQKFVPPDKVLKFSSFPGTELESLASTKDDCVLVCVRPMSNRSNAMVTVLDMMGIKLRNVPVHMGNRYPHRIMENGNHDICMVDLVGKGSSKGCIRILDSTGRHKASYAGVIGYKPSDMFEPRGICCDGENRIIVTDFRNHAVHQLSEDGKYRKILLMQDNGLLHPLSVSLNSQGFLFVGCLYGKVLVRKYSDLSD